MGNSLTHTHTLYIYIGISLYIDIDIDIVVGCCRHQKLSETMSSGKKSTPIIPGPSPCQVGEQLRGTLLEAEAETRVVVYSTEDYRMGGWEDGKTKTPEDLLI